MLAASGIAASVAHRLASHGCCSSTSRCDGGRVEAQKQEMLARPPSRSLKEWQQQGVSAAWTTLLAAVSGLLRVQAALAEEDESLVNDAVSAYARLTAAPRAPDEGDSFNIQLPELNLELPQLDFKWPDFQAPEVDLSGAGGAFSGAADFVADNPVAIVGGIAVVAIPLLVAQFFGRKPDPFGKVSAKVAYEKLADANLNVKLVDIRPAEDVNTEGAPDLRSVRKRVIQVPYKVEQGSEAAAAVVEKLKSKSKKPEETTLYIVDSFDGNSLAVAKLATESGFLAAYAIKGGAEGPNGWRLSELPWLAPKKGFTLDLSSLKDVLDTTFGSDSSSVVPAAVGVAAAAAAGAVVFSEAETALQLLGTAALLQLFVKKFLFAKDREQTFKQIRQLLDTKVAPNALVDDIKSIGRSLASTAEEVTAQVVGPTAAASAVNGVATYETEAPKPEETEAVGDEGAPTLASAEVTEGEVEGAPAVGESSAELVPSVETPSSAVVEGAAPPLDATADPVAVGSSSAD